MFPAKWVVVGFSGELLAVSQVEFMTNESDTYPIILSGVYISFIFAPLIDRLDSPNLRLGTLGKPQRRRIMGGASIHVARADPGGGEPV
ncbi:hypothetical protein L6452_19702 [Arctium lappa]|uniref:Uncharacterized protein n=1 Tax=Arctium lappa TaxID=4217 RepID=A0ACB9BB50_ARCLA|nr:hypothetical protein L6452_19702 [Arctium lappa]